jgi:hypothetical protein
VKENIQIISWSIEFATFIVAALVFWFVWRLGKSDKRKVGGHGKRT